MGYGYALMDRWDFYIYYFLTLIAVTLIGLTVAICGWAGARAGMVVSVLVGVMGVACLAILAMSAYWMWWICVPAIYLGWLGFHSWRRRTEAQRVLPMNFSLSAMFLFVLVVAMVAGGFTIDRRGQKFDDELVDQLARHTGSRVDYVNFGRPSAVTIAPQDEAELRKIVAILKQFSALRAVACRGGTNLPPSQTVAILSEMTNLRSLSLQDLPVNDADLLPLAKLKDLEQLELLARTLTDAGLPNLYPLKRLRNLWLYYTDPMLVTPDGMEKLHDALPNWEN